MLSLSLPLHLLLSMGIGHAKQISLFKTDWKHQYSHGGLLRQRRKGRGTRPLSCKEPLHVVFKIHQKQLRQLSLRSPQTFGLINLIIQTYATRFFIKIEQISIQNDHVHLLIRTSRRSLFHHFFRVVAGQIAQQLNREGLLRHMNVTDTLKPTKKLWKFRPFSRVVRGYKAWKTVRDYIQLNEKEAKGEIKYSKLRLRGLSMSDWQVLWA